MAVAGAERASAAASRISSSTSSAPACQSRVEIVAPAGREVVDDRHLVAAREQCIDQIRADETRAACRPEHFIEVADPRGIAEGRPRGEGPDAPATFAAPCDSSSPRRTTAPRRSPRSSARAGGPTSDKTFKVPYYTWTDADGDHMTIGLKGHVLGPAFPEGYSNWQKTDLHDLIDAELIKEPTDKNVVKAIKKVAKEADELVIATDFDREGELIGLEALEEMLDANPELGAPQAAAEGTLKIKRARYSALTKEEIERAFDKLDELSYPLANAGAARQDIDLLWGATLTRAVSLASRRFGSNFLSVGRVQSPTLGLIVEREMERRAHIAKPFWELFARFQHPDGTFDTHHTVDKFWEKAEADAALAGTSPRRRQGGDGAQEHPQTADPATTPPPSAPTPPVALASPPPARCGSPRTSIWTASSPTRAPITRSTRPRCRSASWSPRWCGSRSSPPRPACWTTS